MISPCLVRACGKNAKILLKWIALVKTFRMIYNLTGFSDILIFIVLGNDIIMTLFLVTWFSNFHILWSLPKAISLQRFNAVHCLSQVLQRDYKNTMMTSL